MKKYVSTIILPIIFSVAFTLLFFWPSLPHITTQFIGDGWDNYEYASYMGYGASQLSQGNFPLSHTNFWRYPLGIDFGRSFDSYLTFFIGTFLTLLFKLPLSYNLTIFTLATLNGICSYALFRHISKSKLLGIVGMVIYGFSFYTLAKSNSHLNLMFIGGFPLFVLSLMHLFTQKVPTMRQYLLVFASLILIALGSLQYLVLVAIFLLIGGICFYYFYKPTMVHFLDKIVYSLSHLFVAASFATVAFLLFFGPHFLAMLSGAFQFVGTGRELTLEVTTPAVSNFFLPNGYSDLLIKHIATNSARISIESIVFLGWAEIIVFILFFLTKTLHKRFKLFLFTVFFIFWSFALGYGKENNFFLLPYHFLGNLPIFKIIAEPGRYFVIFYLLFTTCIVMLFVHFPWKKIRLACILLFLLLVTIERLPSTIKMVPTFKNESYIKAVKNTPTQAVLDVPVNLFHAKYNILSLWYEKPIVNGYFHWSADGPAEKEFLYGTGLLDRYSCSELDPILTSGMHIPTEEKADEVIVTALKAQGVKTIVIHKDDKFLHPVCKNVRLRLARLLPQRQELVETATPKQVVVKTWDGPQEISFYFPKNGTFYLDSVYFYTTPQTTFYITSSDGNSFDYSWKKLSIPNAFDIEPKYKIELPVTAGSQISFTSASSLENAYFALSYRYISDADSVTIPLIQPLKKIFEDDSTAVYQL